MPVMIVGISIVIVISIIAVIVFVSPMLSMHPLDSGKIEGTDIIAIKNRINDLFFIPAGEDWIVVDAGSDVDSVKREMEQLSIDGDRVKGVFLTHTDYDHVASLVLFPNAAIYLSEQEKQMIDGSTYRQLLKKNKLPALRDSNKIVGLRDGEEVELCKLKVRMLLAPGHTKGSAMYAVDEKYLFTGDAFRVKDDCILVHPYTMDKAQAQRTIEGIKGELEKYERVFTAHYGWIEKGRRFYD